MTAGIDFDPARRDAIAAKMNLSVLQRADPAVRKVLKLASHVCLYQLDDNHAWRRLDIEGSLFVVELDVDHPNNSARTRHRIVIINRKSLDNYSDDVVVGNKEIELQDQMIMYTNSKQKTIGIWFYQKPEASSLFQLLQALVQGKDPSPPQSPPAEIPSSSHPPDTSASQSTESARVLDNSPRSRRTQKRAPRNVNLKNARTRQVANPRLPKPAVDAPQQPSGQSTTKETPSVQDNSLERFFPGLKHTHGVAGATLPPDVNTSSVMESVAVTTLTSDIESNKKTATEFKPTSEIDEAIIIASDNGLPDSILSKPSSSSDHLGVSEALNAIRSKAEKKPRSDPRRKTSPKPKPASKMPTPLKFQRPKRGPPASKPGFHDASAQRPSALSVPLNAQAFEARYTAERRKRTLSPPQKSVHEQVPNPVPPTTIDRIKGNGQASARVASMLPSEESKRNAPSIVQSGSRPVQAAEPKTETLGRKVEAQAEARVAPAASTANEKRTHLPAAPKSQEVDTDPHLPRGEVKISAGLPLRNGTGTMEDARRHLQALSMPLDTLNDPLLRGMPPFRFPSGDMPIAHTAPIMPSPIAPPPQPPAPFTAGMHPQMAMLMQHQLFLQQQQFLAQQQHQRRMQLQNIPLQSMPTVHESESRSAGNLSNDFSSSHPTSAVDSAADLMRMINAGGRNGAVQKPREREMSEEEKGKSVAQGVAVADRKGELSTCSAQKMDRSEFRAVLQRMLTDKRLFESVYANYVSANEN